MITVVGRCVGAQQLDQASYFTKKLLLWDYIAQGATNALILIFLNPLLSVYTLSDDPPPGWLLVMIHAGSAIFLWPAGFVLPNACVQPMMCALPCLLPFCPWESGVWRSLTSCAFRWVWVLSASGSPWWWTGCAA